MPPPYLLLNESYEREKRRNVTKTPNEHQTKTPKTPNYGSVVKYEIFNMTRAWDKEKSESPTGIEPHDLPNTRYGSVVTH